MKAKDHQAREQALAPPYRHVDAEQSGKQAVGRAGNGVGIEQVLPHDGERPLRHDVRENENGTQIFSPGKVGPRDQECEQTAVENGDDAGADGKQDGIEKRRPEVRLRHAAGEEVNIVDRGIAGGLPRQVGVDGAGVDFEGVFQRQL